ncbi:hypothetical protein HKX48_007112 [Thoreauomyces humboldtii]|nr:hypothetical protein HKX48_007112 [Thoreauomyces humboldtii]
MAALFVPKSRKVKFEATLTLHDMSNLPYVSGLYFVKWKLKNGGSFEGTTAKAVVKDHTVTWETQIHVEPTIVIGKDGVLQSSELVLSVKQTVNAGKSTEDVGMVSVNLAECAGQRSTSRRYLLQDSRVNSIMRVTIGMRLIKGDSTFTAPEVTARDLSTEGLRNVFSEHGADSNSLEAFSSLIDDPSMTHRDSPLYPLHGGADDPNVDLVERLFAASAQARTAAN